MFCFESHQNTNWRFMSVTVLRRATELPSPQENSPTFSKYSVLLYKKKSKQTKLWAGQHHVRIYDKLRPKSPPQLHIILTWVFLSREKKDENAPKPNPGFLSLKKRTFIASFKKCSRSSLEYGTMWKGGINGKGCCAGQTEQVALYILPSFS